MKDTLNAKLWKYISDMTENEENSVVKTLLFARITVQLAMQLMQPLV